MRFKDGEFTRYGTQHGLPNEHVSQILKDGRGQLWLGTRGGICRVRREDVERFASGEADAVTFITYGTSDGLPRIECSGGFQPGCWSDSSGRMWFTTVKGPTWVRSGQLPYNPHPPPVFIEELWVDKELVYEPIPSPRRGREVSPALEHSSAGGASPLRISAGRHYFEFKFTALSLVAPNKVRFRWRLKGADRDWVGGGTDRSVSYSYLPPGAYEFEVQASNNDGVWSKQGSRLQFAVLPYFWETWWFRTLVLLAIVFLLYAAYRFRIARLRALERLRLRIARDLHDDVGANLGSISLLAQVMEKHPSTEDAHQIRSIVGQTVDTLRDIVWFIDPTHERMSDLVARMAEIAKSMLPTASYTFEQSGDFRSAGLPLDFRRNVMPIFKEAIHNAIKHAHASHITVQVSCTNNHFCFAVRDNGCGFDATRTSRGNGLKNFRRRAAETNAEIEIKSAPSEGTSITFMIDVVGSRNRFLVKITQGSHEEFIWLDITDFNLAYGQGDVLSHTFAISSHVPISGTPLPPLAPIAKVEGSQAVLTWRSSPSADVVGYRVYRAAPPTFAYERVGGLVTSLVYTDTYNDGDRIYAITAMDTISRESGFSHFVWTPHLRNPMAIDLMSDGRRVVLDPDDGYPLMHQRSDGRYIESFGSQHYHLEWTQFLAVDTRDD